MEAGATKKMAVAARDATAMLPVCETVPPRACLKRSAMREGEPLRCEQVWMSGKARISRSVASAMNCWKQNESS